METQISQAFDKKTKAKILKGALIAGSGAFLTYILQYLSAMDFGMFTPIVVAICGISVNAVKEYFAGIKI